jgi:hypothetical protein
MFITVWYIDKEIVEAINSIRCAVYFPEAAQFLVIRKYYLHSRMSPGNETPRGSVDLINDRSPRRLSMRPSKSWPSWNLRFEKGLYKRFALRFNGCCFGDRQPSGRSSFRALNVVHQKERKKTLPCRRCLRSSRGSDHRTSNSSARVWCCGVGV